MSVRYKSIRLTAISLIACAATLSFVPMAAHAQESAGVEALLKQAEYWRQKGRGDLAERALRRARQLDPDNVRVRAASQAQAAKPAKPVTAAVPTAPSRTEPAPQSALTGRTTALAAARSGNASGNARVAGFDALERGNLQNAATQFQRALNANARDGDALGGLGLVRLRQGRFPEAADLLERASRYGRADQWKEGLGTARFFADLGEARAQLAQGQLDAAQAKAEQLVRSGYAKPAPALELLADIYEQQGRFADAADLYRQAGNGGMQDDLRLQVRAARGRALAAVQRGDYETAEREFQNGLLLDRNDPWIRYEFARFMIDRNRLADADGLLRSLTVSGQPDSLYAAALIRNDLGQAGAADELIDRIPDAQRTAPMRNLAIKLKTDGVIARAKALGQSGRAGEGLASLQQVAAMSAVPASNLPAIANAMFDLGDPAGAAALAERAFEMGMTNLEDYEGLIRILARTGRDDLAQVALQRAAQQAGNDPDRQRVLARVNGALAVSRADQARLSGYYAEAFDLLQSAWNAAPENPDILSALARLYQSGNMSAPAAQTYQLVLAREPQDKGALLGLAATAQAAGDRTLSEKAQADALRAYPADYEVRIALAQVEQSRGNERAALRLLKEARELYARQQGGNTSIGPGSNPFAAMGAGSNPFRNQAPVTSTVNPFALGSGTRLPLSPAAYNNSPAVGGGYGSYQPTGTASSPAWQQQNAPMQGWPASSSPAPYGSNPAPVGNYGKPSAFGYPPSQSGGQVAAYSADPVMAKLQADIAALSQESGPRADFETSYRKRSGEDGLSALDEIKGTAKLSTSIGGGRVYARGDAVVIDSGRPARSGLARFGRNGTIEAQSIVDEVESPLVEADTQHRSGVAIAMGYESRDVQVEAGSTPIGMGKTKLTFSAAASPRIGQNTNIRAWGERKPMTDSIVSYAGARDPVTGERWGQVMRTGGGLGLSYDQNGTGIYAEGRYNRYTGTNVRDNESVEVNLGGYLRAFTGARSSFTAGLNLNYQSYDNNQNYFSFGHGGYFSPQNFLSVGFPLRYAFKDEKLDIKASVTPGFQSYDQDEVALYPTDPAAQAQLDALKLLNSDVRSVYDGLSKTGFAMSADASIYYNIDPTTQIGGLANYNSFGSYNEFRSMLGVRKNFGSVK